jgi:hypothetical protein
MRSIPLFAIRDAASGIYNVVHRTPMISLPLPPRLHNQLEEREILLELEILEPTGSFAMRGRLEGGSADTTGGARRSHLDGARGQHDTASGTGGDVDLARFAQIVGAFPQRIDM